jgi:transcriptional regulator with PAS, ATPase and Fis domain
MVYIQIHFTSHGIGYLKNILSHFYLHPTTNNKKLDVEGLSQEELNQTWDKKKKGEAFKHVYYLHANQNVFDQISTVSSQSRKNIFLNDELIEGLNLQAEWKKVIDSGKASIKEEIEFIKKDKSLSRKQDLLLNLYWRNIQHYPIKDQLYWFSNESNAKAAYNEKNFTDVNLTEEFELNDLRDHVKIANALSKFIYSIKDKHKSDEFLINISLGSYETQLAWFVLAENGILPSGTRFISTYDDKNSTSNRFKHLSVKEVSTKLFNVVSESVKIFEKTKSEKRKLANALMKHHYSMGFSILILGERGVGKSELAKKHKRNDLFVSQNCAAFDDDSKAESALFGHMKGSFTDAKSDFPGLFQEANSGTLFLDEVHHLSKVVQGKLMKALQTDDENFFTILPLGGKKKDEKRIKCNVIFASNLQIEELKQRLLPDFYDRISQLIVEIPALRETPEDREEDWKIIWKQLKFGSEEDAKQLLFNDRNFSNWLKKQSLFGNFRDLQKIAILYRSYSKFNQETIILLKREYGYNNPYDYVKGEYDKYYIQNLKGDSPYLNTQLEPNGMVDALRADIAQWAENTYGSIPEAYNKFRTINPDTPTAKTLYEWKKLIKK